MKSLSNSYRESWIDIVRVIATIAVVILHTDTITISKTNYVGGISWWFALYLDSLSKTAVPLFVMISGYLQLNQTHNLNYRQIVDRSFRRVIVPLVFWSAFYLWWQYYWKGVDLSVSAIINQFLNGGVLHLYFLWIILGLYFSIRPLNYFLKKYFEVDKVFLLSTFFFISFLITGVKYFILNTSLIGNSFVIFLPYVSYFLAGSLVSKIRISRLLQIINWLVYFGIALVTSIFFYISIKNPNTASLLWSQEDGYYLWEAFSPAIIVMTLLAWINFQQLKGVKLLQNQNFTKSLSALATTSFGVYLIHPIIIDLLDHYANFVIHLVQSNLWLHHIKRILSVGIISNFLIAFFIKIPYLDMLFGHKKLKNIN